MPFWDHLKRSETTRVERVLDCASWPPSKSVKMSGLENWSPRPPLLLALRLNCHLGRKQIQRKQIWYRYLKQSYSLPHLTTCHTRRMADHLLLLYSSHLLLPLPLLLSLLPSSSSSPPSSSPSPPPLRNTSVYPVCVEDGDCEHSRRCFQYMCYPWQVGRLLAGAVRC